MAQKFTITAELNLQTKNLSQVVNNLKQQFQGANLNIKIKDLAAAESSVRNISKGAKDAQKSFSSLGSSIAAAAKRFSAITLATGTFVGLTRAIKNSIGAAIEFDREMVKISQATGKTISQLQGLKNEVGSVASTFGVSSKELIEAARNLTQAGFAADKVSGSLKLLAQTDLAATFDSIADTTEGVIAVLSQFGRQAMQSGTEVQFLEKSLSAINQVSKEFAVESGDLITAIRTTGSAFETAGGSLDELIALFTSVRATTRESAESISTGFRTIFTRTQRLDTINNLKKLGIELQDAEGKFVGPMEAVKRLSIALNTIDPKDFRFNLIVEQLGGFRQVSKVIPLIQQFATAQKALSVAQGSSGSLAKDAATAQQSLSVQIQKTREEFSRFIRELTESKTFKDTVGFLLDMANAFIKVADTLKPLIPMIAGFGAIKLGQSLLPGIQSLVGAKKKSQGGKIHAFASGGLVPGQGNGDTVPAMLSPGEFVIRKSSVKKLGVNNLANANKYGVGGSVQYYKEAGEVKKDDPTRQRDLSTVQENIKAVKYTSVEKAQSKNIAEDSLPMVSERNEKGAAIEGAKKKAVPFDIGAAFLRPGGIKADTTGFVPIAKDQEISQAAHSTVLGKKFYQGFKDSNKEGERGVYYKLHSRSLADPASTEIENKIQSKVIEAVDQSADIASNMLGVKSTDAQLGKILKKANIDQVTGNIFEATLLNLSAPFDEAETSSVSFDFKNGLGKAASLFGKDKDTASLVSNPTDARSSFTTDSVNKISPKIANLVKEEVDKVNLKDLTEKKIPELMQSDDGRGLRLSNFVSLTGKKTATTEEIQASLNKAGYSLKAQPSSRYSITKGIGVEGEEFAMGGSPSGTDTVPAMLTPGEFVINKKSAQKIGGSALNKMNKVGKFADGGPVQYLAPGGNVGKFGKVSGATALGGAKASPFQAYSTKAAGFNPPPSGPPNNPSSNASSAAATQTSQALQEVGTAAISLKEQLNAVIESTSNAGAGIFLLGSAISSVTAQMSGMDKAYADSITSFTGTFSTLYGIGQSLKTTGASFAANIITNKKYKDSIDKDTQALNTHSKAVSTNTGGSAGGDDKYVAKFTKALKIADGAITGFAIASAAQSAIVAYQTAKAEKEADKLSKAMDSFTKNLSNEAEVRSGMNRTLIASEKAQARANAASGTGAMAGGGIGGILGGVLGGLVGGPVGAQIGATIASTIGTSIGAQLSNSFDQAKITQAATQLSDAFLISTRGTSSLNKFMTDIDKKSTGDVGVEFSKVAAEAAKAQTALNSFDPKILETGSEIMKAQFNKAAESVASFQQGMDKLSGALVGKIAKDIQTAASVGKILDVGPFVKDFAKITKDMSDAKYAPQIARAKSPVEKRELKVLGEQEVAKATAEYEKTLLQVKLQTLAQERALVLERQTREKVIGTLNEEVALRATLERFNANIERAAKSSDQLDAAFSDSVQGLKSSAPDASVFDMEFPDTSSLNEAMSVLSSIGPIGEKLATSLLDLNKISLGLGPALEALTAKSFGSGNIDDEIKKVVQDAFGVDVGSAVGQQLVKIIGEQFRGVDQEKGGVQGAIDPKKIKEQFEGLAKDIREKGKGVATALAEADNKRRAIADKINESEKRKLELTNQSIDSYQRLVESVAQAQGRPVSLLEKNSMRFAKQVALLGKNANKSIPQLGKDLGNARKSLSSGQFKNDPMKQAEVSRQASRLQDALKNLADQSGRTKDTLNELEKVKAQREQIQQNLTDYAFGTTEDRQGKDEVAAATNQALQTGDINSIEGPMRKEVLGMLDTMGEFGKQAKKQLTANYFAGQGNQQLAQAALAESSTPEQAMIGELQTIYQQEIAAQKELMALEDSYSQSQIAEYQKITNQIATLNQTLAATLAEVRAPADRAVAAVGAPVPKLTTETIDAETAKINGQLQLLDKSIVTFTTNIDRINTVLAKIETQKKAQGGLIYRAGGGDIFQPKGTDTVPAMLTPGEFVMQKSAVDRIGAGNLNAMNKGYARGGKVGYYAQGGLVDPKVQKRIDEAKTEEEKYDLAKGYANSKKNEIDIKTEKPGAFGRLMGRKAEPDYSSLRKMMIGIGKKADGSYENTASLESILKGESANLFKTKEGFQGGDVFARELSDDDQARALAFTDASSGAIPSFGRGVLQGMTSMPFVDIASIIGKGMGIDIDKLEWEGKPIGSLTKASLYDVVARNFLPPAPSDENSKYWEDWGLEGGKLLNPLEWLTGSVAAGAGSKLMKFVATKGIVGRTVAKAATSGSSFIFKAIDNVLSAPFKAMGGVIKKGLGMGAKKGGSELVQEGGEAVLKSSLDAPLKRLTADQIKEKVAKEAIEKEAKEKAAKELADKQTKEAAEQVQKQAALEAEQKKALEQAKKQKAQDSAENIKKEKGSDTTMDEDWAKTQAEGKTIKPQGGNAVKGAMILSAGISAAVTPEMATPPVMPEIAPSQLDTVPQQETAPVVEAPPAEVQPGAVPPAATEEVKKKKRRRRGMNPNAMMPMMNMGLNVPNWIQQATAQAQAAQQRSQNDWFKFMNQGPQVIAGPGFRYFASGGMAKGTDTVPAMLTPGEFVMNKSAVEKHGVGMMQHLNSGGEVKYFAGGSFVGPQQPEDDYNLSRSEMTSESIRTGLAPSELSAQRDKYTEKRDKERAKAKAIMDNIKKEKEDKARLAKSTKAAGSTLGAIVDPSAGFASWDKNNKFLPPGMGPSPTPAPAATAAAPASPAQPARNTNAQRTIAARNARRSGSGDINVGSMANNAMVNAGQQQGPGSLNALRDIAQRRQAEGKPPAAAATADPMSEAQVQAMRNGALEGMGAKPSTTTSEGVARTLNTISSLSSQQPAGAAANATGAAAAAMATPAPIAGAAAYGAAGAAAAPEAPRRPSTQKGGGPMRDRAIQANAAMKANRMGFQQSMMNRNRPMTRSQMMEAQQGGGMQNQNPAAQQAGQNTGVAGQEAQSANQGTPTAGGKGGAAPDMSSFASSVESLNQVATTFSTFTETLSNLAKSFSGLTVTHTVTVDGSINVNGVNATTISDLISKNLTAVIGAEVTKQINSIKK
jgi:hypothetical protein